MKLIELINLDTEATDLLLTSPEAFEHRYRISLGVHRSLAAHVARQTRQVVAPRSTDARWWGYLAINPGDRTVLGTCGFRAAPDTNGYVEITYYTFPGLEGKGIATAMARRLLGIAFSSSLVQTVVAHTLPESNASTRVLAKLGFSLLGSHMDSEDGEVWRWILTKSAWESMANPQLPDKAP